MRISMPALALVLVACSGHTVAPLADSGLPWDDSIPSDFAAAPDLISFPDAASHSDLTTSPDLIAGSGDLAAGQTCAGFAGKQCPAGQYCDLLPGACKGADIPGTCVIVPGACGKNLDLECGCDGKTYDNDCLRLMAHVQLAHKGACP